MHQTRFGIMAPILALMILSPLSAIALPSSKQSGIPQNAASLTKPKYGHRLLGRIQQTETRLRCWRSSSITDIDNGFVQHSSTGGPSLVDELPKDMIDALTKDDGGWSHDSGLTPGTDIFCPNWHAWVGQLHDAMYQIRWEVWTDPKQGASTLGHYRHCTKHGSSLWTPEGTPREGVMVQNSCWEPGLSHHAYFKGNARVLVEIHPNRRLETRVLSSTLTPKLTETLKQSLDALNGHPSLTYPSRGIKYGTVPIVYNFGFDDANMLNQRTE